MLNFSPLAYKLAAGAVLALCVAVHLYHDRSVRNELTQTKQELVQTQNELQRVKDDLVRATRDRQQVDDALKQAEKASEKIRDESKQVIEKMKAKKLPSDCTKLSKWLVDNKEDLNW